MRSLLLLVLFWPQVLVATGYDFSSCGPFIEQETLAQFDRITEQYIGLPLPEGEHHELSRRLARLKIVSIIEEHQQKVAVAFLHALEEPSAFALNLPAQYFDQIRHVLGPAKIFKLNRLMIQAESLDLFQDLSQFRLYYTEGLVTLASLERTLKQAIPEDREKALTWARARLIEMDIAEWGVAPPSVEEVFGHPRDSRLHAELLTIRRRAEALLLKDVPQFHKNNIRIHLRFVEDFQLLPDLLFKRYLDVLDQLL